MFVCLIYILQSVIISMLQTIQKDKRNYLKSVVKKDIARRSLPGYVARTTYPSGCTEAIWQFLEQEIHADPTSTRGQIVRRAEERVATRPAVTHRYGNRGSDGFVTDFVSDHYI